VKDTNDGAFLGLDETSNGAEFKTRECVVSESGDLNARAGVGFDDENVGAC
jgi:hypothetical protein